MTKPVETLVLARLFSSRALSPRELRNALSPLLPPDRDAVRELDETLEALTARALVAKAGKTRVALTDDGRKAGAALLGVPESARLPWMKAVGRLAAQALGAPADAAASTDRLRAAAVAARYGLDREAKWTTGRLRDALAWKALGLEPGRPFTRAAAQGVLLGKLAGVDGLRPDKAIEVLAAAALDAQGRDAAALRRAALRRLFAPPPQTPEAPDARPTVEDFVGGVLAAAHACTPSERFGESKVFISAVFRRFSALTSMDELEFKRRLVEANRLGQLRLSRADLVDAMDPSLVAASETRHDNATFHFVRL